MSTVGVAQDDATRALVRAVERGEYVTGDEEVHVDEEGNVELG
jgi:hypothetical protein